jgi:PqqD family protein of HPr-rel-A system
MRNFNIPPNLAISENGFIFMPTSGETFTVNEIGSRILKLLQQGQSENEIIEQILSEYDVDRTTLEKDLNDFLGQLKNYRVVEEK